MVGTVKTQSTGTGSLNNRPVAVAYPAAGFLFATLAPDRTSTSLSFLVSLQSIHSSVHRRATSNSTRRVDHIGQDAHHAQSTVRNSKDGPTRLGIVNQQHSGYAEWQKGRFRRDSVKTNLLPTVL